MIYDDPLSFDDPPFAGDARAAREPSSFGEPGPVGDRRFYDDGRFGDDSRVAGDSSFASKPGSFDNSRSFDGFPDAALAARLSGALGRAASSAAVPGDAWTSFQARVGQPATLFEPVRYEDGGTGYEAPTVAATVRTAPVMTAPRRTPRWRAPLIAAASVVVLAGGITAVSTGLIGPGHDGKASAPAASDESGETGDTPTTPTAGPSADGHPVEVPITCAPMSVTPCAAGTTLKLGLTEDPTSGGTRKGLAVELSGDTSDTSTGSAFSSSNGDDGSSLALWGMQGKDSMTEMLYGAVGPEVAQVQVLQLSPTLNRLPPLWIFTEAGAPPVPVEDSVDPVQAAWTEIAPGWHGYAVHLLPALGSLLLRAFDSTGAVLQTRMVNLITGESSDDVIWGTAAALASGTAGLNPDRGTLEQLEASRKAVASQAASEESQRAEAIQSVMESARASSEALESAVSSAQANQLAMKVQWAKEALALAKERQVEAKAALAAAQKELDAARAALDAADASGSDDGRPKAVARELTAVTDYGVAAAAADSADAAVQQAVEALDAARGAQNSASGG